MSADHYREHLNRLIRQGREIQTALAKDLSHAAAARIWQRDCAVLVSHLSGGSKAHWLSRAFSDAFLIRQTTGGPVTEADPVEIVGRIVDVLGRGAAALAPLNEPGAAATTPPAPRMRRFDFVHNTELRPILEQAFADYQDALNQREFGQALVLSCGILEAILTDALELRRLEDGGLGLEYAEPISDWPFDARITAAERAGLIRGGCARLPPVARHYRDLADAEILRSSAGVSERDARVAGQVLRIVMRDLEPGR